MDVVDLDSVDLTDFTDSERAIFNVLRATLQYPATPSAKNEKLANDMIFLCKKQDADVGGMLWGIWTTLIDIVYLIPPDHPWQNSLVQSLLILRRLEDHATDDGKSIMVKDLPGFDVYMSEIWQGDQNITYDGEEPPAGFTKWQNWNSFLARLTSSEFAPWLQFPILQLREALEEPALKGSVMEFRVWVATEWIIHSGDPIFQIMFSTEEFKKDAAESLAVGRLCENISPLSIERWEYWQRRFVELSLDADSIGLSIGITTRISDALKRMDDILERRDSLLKDM